MDCLRQRRGLNIDDKSEDSIINKYKPNKVFKEILEWEGLIGWDEKIKSFVEEIYGVELNNSR
jgi:hypothetical protein